MSRAISSTSTFPPDWPRRELSDLGEIRGGTTPNRTVPSYWDGNIPWVTPGELTGLASKYVFETRDKITQAGLNSASLSLLPRDSLLVTTRATLGSVALAGVSMTTNQGFRSVIFNRDADPHFFYHLFPKLQRELVRRASGTTFLEISGREFGKIQVPLPPVPEQRRIAAILDTIDDAIRKTEQVIAKLKRMKRGLLHDLLTRGIDENGELRDPERNPEQFKDSSLGRVPKSWIVAAVGRCCITYAGATPPRNMNGMFGGTIPWVKSSEVNAPSITQTEEHLTSLGLQTASIKLVPPQTPLIAMYGATAGVVSWLAIEAATNQAVLAVVPRSKETDSRWLFWALRFYAHKLIASVQGSGQPNLSKRLIDSFALAMPASKQEQVVIRGILDQHAERIGIEAEYLQKLRTLKQGLMDDLLTGRVRVRVDRGANSAISSEEASAQPVALSAKGEAAR